MASPTTIRMICQVLTQVGIIWPKLSCPASSNNPMNRIITPAQTFELLDFVEGEGLFLYVVMIFFLYSHYLECCIPICLDCSGSLFVTKMLKIPVIINTNGKIYHPPR